MELMVQIRHYISLRIQTWKFFPGEFYSVLSLSWGMGVGSKLTLSSKKATFKVMEHLPDYQNESDQIVEVFGK